MITCPVQTNVTTGSVEWLHDFMYLSLVYETFHTEAFHEDGKCYARDARECIRLSCQPLIAMMKQRWISDEIIRYPATAEIAMKELLENGLEQKFLSELYATVNNRVKKLASYYSFFESEGFEISDIYELLRLVEFDHAKTLYRYAFAYYRKYRYDNDSDIKFREFPSRLYRFLEEQLPLSFKDNIEEQEIRTFLYAFPEEYRIRCMTAYIMLCCMIGDT